jgi:hypothetical protein
MVALELWVVRQPGLILYKGVESAVLTGEIISDEGGSDISGAATPIVVEREGTPL